MLSGIHPILTGDLLAALDRLGHGDELVVADANFPAHRSGVTVVEIPGHPSPDVVEAIRTVVPVDAYEDEAVLLMGIAARPDGSEATGARDVQLDLRAAAAAAPDRVGTLERFAFYDRAARAGLVVRTGEQRPYGNLILRKGVVAPYTGRAAA
ncbi:transport protein RbsD/FucU [Agromyces protaetiae]|uniref:Transport protein RbsD/FucU n=1 Tax=Agromyces protaetiae TaxID=2509455 RepID=A0A4P6FLT9_9MICO|nr:transport protein RbsD/FucU [Agromyces protaetiae]